MLRFRDEGAALRGTAGSKFPRCKTIFRAPARRAPRKPARDRASHRFAHPHEPARLLLSDLLLAFPDQSDNSVRKKLKQISDFKRGGILLSVKLHLSLFRFDFGVGDESGSWILKDQRRLMSDDAVQRNLAPPDEVALHEAMLAGAQRLHDFGIKSYVLVQITRNLKC